MNKIFYYSLLGILLLLASCGDDGLSGNSQKKDNDQDLDLTTATIDSNFVYKLPVIFHVLYKDKNDASQYIPAARLKSLIEYVNQIYKGGIYGESASVNIEFVLAETNENGQKLSTPGVEYIYYEGEYPIDANEFMVASANTKYLWDPNEYINVMMYHFKDIKNGELLGISHLPYTIDGDHKQEGLQSVAEHYIRKSQLGYPLCSAINSKYAGQASDGRYFQSDRYTNANHQPTFINTADIVVTTAHELGHYLGLYHLFTEDNKGDKTADILSAVDSCGDTDYCKDTPSYNRAEYYNYVESLLSGPDPEKVELSTLLTRHSCEQTEFISANVMDYFYTLGYKFSTDQKKRIREVLYYSPLIPGPKLNGVNKLTRAGGEPSGIVYNKPRIIRCLHRKSLHAERRDLMPLRTTR